MSWLAKLRGALGKSREQLAGVETLAQQRRPLDREFWDELEEILISADFGVPTTEKILDGLHVVAGQELWRRSDQAVARFKDDVKAFLTLPGGSLELKSKPAVILVVGVNGSGKTTTIGKLGRYLSSQGKRVMFVAADTFRAAAAEQLTIWAERSGAELVRGRDGSDPSSVVFDGLAAAKSRNVDIVIIDTAGRLQTKTNLMEELKKMRRVIERETGAPPDETLLVVDGTTGQNAISQARLYRRYARGPDQVHRPRRRHRRTAAVRAGQLHQRTLRTGPRRITNPRMCHAGGTAAPYTRSRRNSHEILVRRPGWTKKR
jgi:fused signal recognition particle receptor